MAKTKKQVIKKVIADIVAREGGYKYVNNKNDSGGETYAGITKATARKYGYEGDMAEMPNKLVDKIYTEWYLDKVMFSEMFDIAPRIAEEVVDTGVLCSPARGVQNLQRCLNALNCKQEHYADVAEDGLIGPKTLEALQAFIDKRGLGEGQGEHVLYRLLNCRLGNYLIDLTQRREKDEEFMYGWASHRVDDF